MLELEYQFLLSEQKLSIVFLLESNGNEEVYHDFGEAWADLLENRQVDGQFPS